MKNEDIQMNEFESILQREKDAKYQLPNKELFSFAVMAKIAAKKSRHSTQRTLISVALLNFIVIGFLFLNPGNPIDNAFGWIIPVALKGIFQVSQAALLIGVTLGAASLTGVLVFIGLRSR